MNVVTFCAVFNILLHGGAALGLLFFIYFIFVEFGFFDSQFTGVERGMAYLLQVGTISGPKPDFVTVTISLTLLTAGKII